MQKIDSKNLTCLTCQVSLPSSSSQKDHYKSEWHLYNLKRKLNQLKSITEDEFNSIKNKHQNEQKELMEKLNDHQKALYCQICGKNFLNPKAFEQHKSSGKHIQLSNKANNPETLKKSSDNNQKPKKIIESAAKEEEEVEEFNESDWEEINSDEEQLETIPIQECLFCGHESKNVEKNLSHMSNKHSFFIPDVEYCIDVKGLLKYLGTKIASGKLCLWCSDNGKTFPTKKSAQQHMIDVGHTKINFHNRLETLVEFEDFYDYSSSYPSEETEGEENDDDDDDEEDDEVLQQVIDDGSYQLRLPSGAVIGHRALFIYYKQKLGGKKPNVIDRSKNKELLKRVTTHYKSLGWNGSGSMAMQHAKDVQYVNRVFQKQKLKIGQKNNRQAHFRSQMGF